MLVRVKIAGKWYGKSFKNLVDFTYYTKGKYVEGLQIIGVIKREN